jgi:hypothetical protein
LFRLELAESLGGLVVPYTVRLSLEIPFIGQRLLDLFVSRRRGRHLPISLDNRPLCRFSFFGRGRRGCLFRRRSRFLGRRRFLSGHVLGCGSVRLRQRQGRRKHCQEKEWQTVFHQGKGAVSMETRPVDSTLLTSLTTGPEPCQPQRTTATHHRRVDPAPAALPGMPPAGRVSRYLGFDEYPPVHLPFPC